MRDADADVVAATLEAFLDASGAVAATAVLEGAIVRAATGEAATLEADDGTETAAAPAEARPLSIAPRALPPFEADAIAGEVSGPIGALEHAAEATRALAGDVGAGRVVLVQWPTRDDTLFAISARVGEGLVLSIGDEQYEMAAAWPPPRDGLLGPL